MTASAKPKTPSMSLRVREGVSEQQILSYCKRASRLTLAQIVDKIEVREKLTKHRRRQFIVDIHFYPKTEYQEEYEIEGEKIRATFSAKFPLILRKLIQLEYKKLKANLKTQMADVGQGQAEKRSQKAATNAEDADEVEDPIRGADDDASEVGDGDADDEKRARQTKEQTTYDTDEEEEDFVNREYDEADMEDEIEGRGAYAKKNDADDSDSDSDDGEAALAEQLERVRDDFKENLKNIATDFEYTDEKVHFELEVCQILYTRNEETYAAYSRSVRCGRAKTTACRDRRGYVSQNSCTRDPWHKRRFLYQRRRQGPNSQGTYFLYPS